MKITEINPDQLSSAMRQYYDIKIEHLNTVVFFQLGDFYELFFEDAIEVSKLLELTLTTKKAGLEERIPMAGIPIKAINDYLKLLMKYDKKIALVDQMENSELGSKIVSREIRQIVTPGTFLDTSNKDNIYLCALSQDIYPKLAYVDISTADGYNSEFVNIEDAINEIVRLQIKEVIVDFDLLDEYVEFLKYYGIVVNKHTLSGRINELTNVKYDSKMTVVNRLLLDYLLANHQSINHITHFEFIDQNDFLKMPLNTQRQLELLTTMKDQEYVGSLFWYLNQTKTAMGRRLLKKWITRPLVNLSEIENRLDCTQAFNEHYLQTAETMQLLNQIYDFERIIGRLNDNVITPREMYQLRKSISNLEPLKTILLTVNNEQIEKMASSIDTMDDINQLLSNALCETNLNISTQGEIINPGFDPEVDRLRDIQRNSTKWLVEFEEAEKASTQIPTLKVKYNKVFGYFIEVTNSQLDKVPDNYVRKQTMTNCERYITDKLKEAENEILNAADLLNRLENEIFANIKSEVKKEIPRLKEVANLIAKLDVLIAFSKLSLENKLVRPTFTTDNELVIRDGRHPIVEKMVSNYITNDIEMDSELSTLLITGPNMAGKSTYMRQVVLIVIMAQIGCFVPASFAKLKIFDKIFTRIGASDDLASGQSTFMVEMNETAHALRNATDNSLIIFDELGRGTSTYDGIALAKAIIEYLTYNLDAKVLFSTHYHELTDLETEIAGIKNVHVKAEEDSKDSLTFYHKVIPGAVKKSYGIEVASLAKLPEAVIIRSREVINQLEQKKPTNTSASNENLVNVENTDYYQLYMKSQDKLQSAQSRLQDLDSININEITPLQALEILQNLQS